MEPFELEELTDQELDGLLREWTAPAASARVRAAIFADTPDSHLERLLPPDSIEAPWYRNFFQTIREAIHPPKLTPLEVTSRAVDPRELKGIRGLYAGNERRAALSSLLVHAFVVTLLLAAGTLKPVQQLVKDQITPLISPDLKPYLPKKGGGGGGARSPLEAKKAELPKVAPRQFTPPTVDPVQNPKLPVTPTIVADEPLPTAVNAGDPLSKLGMSNGSGLGGGIGKGIGGGVGSGKGPGAGPGVGGGFGGGAYSPGRGVTKPELIHKVEPEYSEEARKAKWQGTVELKVVVDEHGRVREVQVTHPLGLGLDQKAIEAVQQWLFKPGMKDGKPVAVIATVAVAFHLL